VRSLYSDNLDTLWMDWILYSTSIIYQVDR